LGSGELRGTVLGIDYGARRTGVAVGEYALRIAHPLTTLHANSDRVRLQQLEPLMREWEPVLVVVGLPGHMGDGEHFLAARCRNFARRLAHRFGVEVRMVDERLTSHAADMSLKHANVGANRRRQVADRVAAQIILETFFSTQ
jgi:putative Holliday junction resolvase